MTDLDTLLRCSWCDRRCRDRAELAEHEARHRREDAVPRPFGNCPGCFAPKWCTVNRVCADRLEGITR